MTKLSVYIADMLIGIACNAVACNAAAFNVLWLHVKLMASISRLATDSDIAAHHLSG